jgi:hypothetical protein
MMRRDPSLSHTDNPDVIHLKYILQFLDNNKNVLPESETLIEVVKQMSKDGYDITQIKNAVVALVNTTDVDGAKRAFQRVGPPTQREPTISYDYVVANPEKIKKSLERIKNHAISGREHNSERPLTPVDLAASQMLMNLNKQNGGKNSKKHVKRNKKHVKRSKKHVKRSKKHVKRRKKSMKRKRR